MQLLGK